MSDYLAEVKFIINLSPDAEGKLTTNIEFAFPNHPSVKPTDSLKKKLLEMVADLSQNVSDAITP